MAIKPYWRLAMETNVIKLKRLSYGKSNEDKELFQKMFKGLQREANTRLGRLEKHNFHEYAYELAMDYIRETSGTNRYEWDKKNMNANYETMLSMRTFISKKSSTIKGQQEIQRKRLSTFREKLGLDTNRFSKGYITNKKLSEFIRFLGSKPIRNTLAESPKGMSNELVELLHGRLQQNDKLRDEILEMFEYFQYSQRHPEDFPHKDERLYYTDLKKYLKDNVFPDNFNLKEMRKKHGL